MKTTTTIDALTAWKFFKELKAGAFIQRGKTGIVLTPTESTEDPPGVATTDRIPAESWTVFLRVLVALQGGRPVKVRKDGAEMIVQVGPKP